MSDAVAKRSEASARMLNSAAKGRALMGGTSAMRTAAEKYLPRFGAESHDAYTARLNSSWLFNGFRKTVRDMTGRVFGKPDHLIFHSGGHILSSMPVFGMSLTGRLCISLSSSAMRFMSRWYC